MSHVFGRAGIFHVSCPANRGCLDLGTSHAASLGSDDSTEARVAAGSGSDGAGSAAVGPGCEPREREPPVRLAAGGRRRRRRLPVSPARVGVRRHDGGGARAICLSIADDRRGGPAQSRSAQSCPTRPISISNPPPFSSEEGLGGLVNREKEAPPPTACSVAESVVVTE